VLRRILAAAGPSFLFLMMCSPVGAATENLFAVPDGIQENPDVLTGASGFGTARFDSVANTPAVDLSFSGLESNANNAHIHCCASSALTNAGVAIDFLSISFFLGVTAGSFSHMFDLGLAATYTAGFVAGSGGTATQARDGLHNSFRGLSGSGLGVACFDIHTTGFPGGEIRGNIALVPEPSSLVLVLLGMSCYVARRRNR
jgi:hypothetical protein